MLCFFFEIYVAPMFPPYNNTAGMKTIIEIFGEGQKLEPLQMCARATVVFILALVLVRLAGRRAFGMGMTFDNVLTILLGAVMSRAITGASPFIATIAAAASIIVLYRLFAWVSVRSDAFGKLVKGEPRLLYKDGLLDEHELRRSLLSKKDLAEGIHTNGNVDSLAETKKIYLERDGKISVIKKDKI